MRIGGIRHEGTAAVDADTLSTDFPDVLRSVPDVLGFLGSVPRLPDLAWGDVGGWR